MLDWENELTTAPRENETIGSVVWELPSGITEVAVANDTTTASITLGTSGLPIGWVGAAICRPTLSGGDVLSAAVPIEIRHQEVVVRS